jgi:threonine dehydratase
MDPNYFMTMISKADIEAAYTPLLYSQKLSRLCGCQVLLKPENSQLTGAFKERGALNKLLSLSPEQKGKGVVAAFAGNHAQAVAEGTGYLCENQCRF